MRDYIQMVGDFHTVFDQKDGNKPRLISSNEGKLRYSLLAEENNEYLEAVEKNDLVGIADALGDQLYIIYGTILKHGLQHKIEEVFREIHRSNMICLSTLGLITFFTLLLAAIFIFNLVSFETIFPI